MSRTQRFRVRVRDAELDVAVELTEGGEARVVVDGSEVLVRDGGDGALLVTREADPVLQRVWLEPGGKPTAAAVDGEVFAIAVRTAQEAALGDALAASDHDPAAGAAIEAPMPGRVVRVLVEEGTAVEAQAPLVIVEAMKMENEVRAPAPGTVHNIAVAAGQTVEAGQLLVELAPHAESSSS